MSRRKPLAARKPGGRLYPIRDPELLSPTEARRLLEASAKGMRDAIWSCEIGRLHVAGKINESLLAAAMRWAELVSSYSQASLSPRPPKTMLLDFAGGTPSDPASDAGRREAKLHEKINSAYLEGRHTLRQAGREAERAVENVVVQNCAAAGFLELEALKAGLQALSTRWSAKRWAR